MRWALVVPHVVAGLAFAGVIAWVWTQHTNRTTLGLRGIQVGLVAAGFALVGTGIALVRFPWRAAGRGDWLWLAVHGGLLALVCVLLVVVLGLHLA